MQNDITNKLKNLNQEYEDPYKDLLKTIVSG
jgi:hypothetical protein